MWPPADGCARAVQHRQCLSVSSWIDAARHDAATDVSGTASATIVVVSFARGNFVRSAGALDPTRLGPFRCLWRRGRSDAGSNVVTFLCCAAANDAGRTAVAGNASATSSAALRGRSERLKRISSSCIAYVALLHGLSADGHIDTLRY